MKVKNITTVTIAIPTGDLLPGETSANLENAVARQLVLEYPGLLAIAPESEHTEDELAGIVEPPPPLP